MKVEIRITKRKVLYLTVCIALIAMLGFVFAVRPNPGHSWSEIGDLPGTIWHSNNDGSGSGLDADTVDGKHASSLDECQIVNADCGQYCSSIGKQFSGGGTTTAVSCEGRFLGGYDGTKCTCWDQW